MTTRGIHIGAAAMVLGAVAIFCSACVSNLDLRAAIADYRKASPCCQDFSGVVFQRIPADEDVFFAVDSSAPAFAFRSSGLSRFKAFELPPVGHDYSLVLRSYLFADGYPARAMAFFYPKMTFLNAARQVVAETTEDQIVYKRSTLSDEPGAEHRLEVSVIVKQTDNERYVLIHTFAHLIGSERTFQGPGGELAVPVGKVLLPLSGGGGEFRVIGAPVTPEKSLKLRVLSSTGQ